MNKILGFVLPWLCLAACSDSLNFRLAEKCLDDKTGTCRLPQDGTSALGLVMVLPASYSNSPNPILQWESSLNERFFSYDLIIGDEPSCKNPIFQFKTIDQQKSLGFLKDGSYYFCLLGHGPQATQKASNDGLKLTLDRQSPRIEGSGLLYRNHLQALDIKVADDWLDTCQWTDISNGLHFENVNNPQSNVWMDADGRGTAVLRCIDLAGNFNNKNLELVWDTRAPVITPLSTITMNASTRLSATVDESDLTWSWTVSSSPAGGDLRLINNHSSSPEVRATVAGIYQIHLDVQDRTGNKSSQQFAINWGGLGTLSVDAGPDLVSRQALALNATTTNATTFSWTQVSGPGLVNFSSTTIENPTVSASAEGMYVLSLTAGDGTTTLSDTMTLTWDTTAPTVDAGSDLLARSSTSTLATVSGATSLVWSKVSGPGSIGFSTPNQENILISASTDGTYILRLTASDIAGNSAYDELILVWDTTPPTVNVGADRTVNTPTIIDATTSGASTYAWTKVSGPGVITFSTASAEDAQVSAAADGTYILHLTATDSAGNTAYDEHENEGTDIESCQNKYINNIIEQDHWPIKQRCRAALSFKSFMSASITIGGLESLRMIRKRQVKAEDKTSAEIFYSIAA